MGKAHAIRTILALAAFEAAWLGAPRPAIAQDAPAPAPVAEQAGFGRRHSFAFTIEKIFGFQSQEFGGDDDSSNLSIDSVGLHPVYWGHVGLFDIESNGLTFGALLGWTYLNGEENDDEAAIVRLGPRIGYAGSLERAFGFWARLGPSLFTLFSDGDDAYALAISGELYAVIMPVDHLGILLGPTADINVWGQSGDRDFSYKSYGFSAGLMGEFW